MKILNTISPLHDKALEALIQENTEVFCSTQSPADIDAQAHIVAFFSITVIP